MPSTTRTTADGYEMTFGVNVLPNYLMLRLLLTRFAAPSRLIITGSVSHFADFRHNLGVGPRPNWALALRWSRHLPGVAAVSLLRRIR
jgi:NAD(P)-dependent dehydrogenase (short-subunit alcohol dehydrogenase family)